MEKFKLTFVVRQHMKAVVSEKQMADIDFPDGTDLSTVRVESMEFDEVWRLSFDPKNFCWTWKEERLP